MTPRPDQSSLLDAATKPCPRCNGAGTISAADDRISCPTCKGNGFVDQDCLYREPDTSREW